MFTMVEASFDDLDKVFGKNVNYYRLVKKSRCPLACHGAE